MPAGRRASHPNMKIPPARAFRSKWNRVTAEHLFRRPVSIELSKPIVSFTFDDFPHSAATAGAAILEGYGAAATYYVSLGLAGVREASGLMFAKEDVERILASGHELGCHTFHHLDAGESETQDFVDSVIANQRRLQERFPKVWFRTFSYPKSAPHPGIKRRMGARFESCRGGGQTFNCGVADLSMLKSYFLEQARGDHASVARLIEENRQRAGWLIFSTHDVCDTPSPYGCTPEFLECAVKAARESGASILPVSAALDEIIGKRESFIA